MTSPIALRINEALRNEFRRLVETDGIAGKITEGEKRLAAFRAILADFAVGRLTVEEVIAATRERLDPVSSPYAMDRRVFAHGWPERLARTQISRFYCQSVMGLLIRQGETDCFIPHSSREKADSACSITLAGKRHQLQPLYELLTSNYRDGKWTQGVVKVPDHPHCTHVVRPCQN
jgi:hypothetical protein